MCSSPPLPGQGGLFYGPGSSCAGDPDPSRKWFPSVCLLASAQVETGPSAGPSIGPHSWQRTRGCFTFCILFCDVVLLGYYYMPHNIEIKHITLIVALLQQLTLLQLHLQEEKKTYLISSFLASSSLALLQLMAAFI